MGIAIDMKKLGEDIVASYDVRVKAIGTLVNNVHRTLKSFTTERKKMADKLKTDLAKGEEERLKGFRALIAETQKFVSNLTKEVSDMIKRFEKEHKEMADKLKANLAKGEEDRLKAFKPIMAEIQKRIKEIETYVKNKLKEFSDAHADMSEELKKELAKYVDDMVNATKKLMAEIQARQKERNAEVADLLEAYKTEREKMAANWQALTSKMAKKRGIKPEVEVEVKVRPVEEAIEEAVEEVPPEISLEDRVLEFIERHPEGVRVSDMEEALGVPRQRLGKIAKTLLDKDKVRKEENLYFPLKGIRKGIKK